MDSEEREREIALDAMIHTNAYLEKYVKELEISIAALKEEHRDLQLKYSEILKRDSKDRTIFEELIRERHALTQMLAGSRGALKYLYDDICAATGKYDDNEGGV